MSKRILSAVLTIALLCSFAMPFAFAAESGYSDVPSNHWASDVIAKWSGDGYGVLQGIGDGKFSPSRGITLGELATILSKTFGYIKRTNAEVTPAWADEAVEKAIAAGVIDYAAAIDASVTVTREQAIRYIAIAYGIEPVTGSSGFVDDAQMGAEYKPFITAFQRLGYVHGKGAGVFDPKGYYTRAEAMTVIDNTTSEITDVSIEAQNYSKSLIIRKAGLTVKDTVVNGDLIIGQGVGDGDVRLENVSVKGNTIIYGGGKNSIYLTNFNCGGSLIVTKDEGSNTVRIVVSGDSSFGAIILESGAILVAQNLADGAKIDVEIPADFLAGSTFEFSGPFDEIINNGTKTNIRINGPVDKLTLNDSATVTGSGKIAVADISENAGKDTTFTTPPATVIGDGKDDVKAAAPGGDSGGGGYTPPPATNNPPTVTGSAGKEFDLYTSSTNNADVSFTINLGSGTGKVSGIVSVFNATENDALVLSDYTIAGTGIGDGATRTVTLLKSYLENLSEGSYIIKFFFDDVEFIIVTVNVINSEPLGSTSPTKAQLDELKSLIVSAQTRHDAVLESADVATAIPEGQEFAAAVTKSTFKTAITAAETALSNSSTGAGIDAAISTLQTAMNAFNAAVGIGEDNAAVNTQPILEAIAKAQAAIDATDFTATTTLPDEGDVEEGKYVALNTSITTLETAISDAEDDIATPPADADAVTASAGTLNAATDTYVDSRILGTAIVVDSITLKYGYVFLYKTKTDIEAYAVISPENITSADINWSFKNPANGDVDGEGCLIPSVTGASTIVAAVEYSSDYIYDMTFEFAITILEKPVEMAGDITIERKAKLKIGEETTNNIEVTIDSDEEGSVIKSIVIIGASDNGKWAVGDLPVATITIAPKVGYVFSNDSFTPIVSYDSSAESGIILLAPTSLSAGGIVINESSNIDKNNNGEFEIVVKYPALVEAGGLYYVDCTIDGSPIRMYAAANGDMYGSIAKMAPLDAGVSSLAVPISDDGSYKISAATPVASIEVEALIYANGKTNSGTEIDSDGGNTVAYADGVLVFTNTAEGKFDSIEIENYAIALSFDFEDLGFDDDNGSLNDIEDAVADSEFLFAYDRYDDTMTVYSVYALSAVAIGSDEAQWVEIGKGDESESGDADYTTSHAWYYSVDAEGAETSLPEYDNLIVYFTAPDQVGTYTTNCYFRLHNGTVQYITVEIVIREP